MKTSTDRYGSTIAKLCVGLVFIAGCRSEPERSAMAQTPHGAEVSSTERTVAQSGRPGVTVRRLSTSNDYSGFFASDLSPDGRYVSLIDWRTYNVAVRDLRTGTLHLLTEGHYQGGQPWEGAGVPIFSRDGKRMAYSWQYGAELQIRVIDFEPDEAGAPRAAEARVVFYNPEFYPYDLFDWSPDGGHILAKVYTSGGNTNQLALISVEDGTYRALKSFDWREPELADFSPDARYVAYDLPLEQASPNRDIFVVSLDGTYEASIVDGPAVDRLLGWHPDGSILFESDRDGTPGVWRVPMSDGRPAGPAELVKADTWEIVPLGFADGHFYYGVNVSSQQLYVASLDNAGGRRTAAPVAVVESAKMRVWGWDWSPDGRFFAYAGSPPGAHGSIIVLRSDRGEELRTVSLALDGRYGRLRWSPDGPDGESLIAFARDDKGRAGFYRIDLETASYTTILRSDELETNIRGNFDVSPDGETLWFITIDFDVTPPGWQLVAYDFAPGRLRTVTPAEWRDRRMRLDGGDRVTVSPDGSKLAVVAQPDAVYGDRWIGTIPVDGGPFSPVAPVEGLIGSLEWTPDGRALLFSTLPDGTWPEEPWETWIVSAEGGEPQPLELMEDVAPRGMKLHPEGRRIAFEAGPKRGEVWVMEGLGEPAATTDEERSP